MAIWLQLATIIAYKGLREGAACMRDVHTVTELSLQGDEGLDLSDCLHVRSNIRRGYVGFEQSEEGVSPMQVKMTLGQK